MLKRLGILGASLILSGVVLYLGRLIGIDNSLVSVIFYGMLAVAFTIYAVNAFQDFKNELYEEHEIVERENMWDHTG